MIEPYRLEGTDNIVISTEISTAELLIGAKHTDRVKQRCLRMWTDQASDNIRSAIEKITKVPWPKHD